MKKIVKSIFVLLMLFGTINAQSKSTYLDSLITIALQNNPQLRSSNQYALAQRQRVSQVKSWDPPQFSVEFYQTPISSFPNPLKNGMENDYSIQQMFPFPGKLSAMGNAAENNANMYNAQFMALERKIIRDVKTAYYELYLVERKISVNQENQELLRNFIEIANKQYQVGMGKQPDIIRAQTELSTLINEGINLYKEKVSIEAMLNTLLNRPVNARLKEITEIYSDIPKWTFEQLSTLSYENRNELKAMNYNIEMNKSELSVSKLEYYPNIMARLVYKNVIGTSNDFWSAMVGVSIPLSPWSQAKFTSKVDENELNIKSAQEQYSSMKNMVSFSVQDALVKIESNRNLVQLYKDTVIPQAQQTLESTTAAYQTGKTEFLMLIDAYRTLLAVRLDYYMSLMNFMSSQAALEQAIGLTVAEIKEKLQ